jgi:hypothetical protein
MELHVNKFSLSVLVTFHCMIRTLALKKFIQCKYMVNSPEKSLLYLQGVSKRCTMSCIVDLQDHTEPLKFLSVSLFSRAFHFIF